jgi:peroxiredoxin
MQAPEQDVVLSTGEVRPLADLYSEGPAMLVFVRHLGCGFCKEQVAQLKDLKDANVVFVSMGAPEEAAEFKQKMASPHTFISDPKRELYKAFGLAIGTFSQMLNPNTVIRSVGAMAKGYTHSRPRSDPKQLGGAFLVQPDGHVSWFRKSRDAADTVTAKEVREQLSL